MAINSGLEPKFQVNWTHYMMLNRLYGKPAASETCLQLFVLRNWSHIWEVWQFSINPWCVNKLLQKIIFFHVLIFFWVYPNNFFIYFLGATIAFDGFLTVFGSPNHCVTIDGFRWLSTIGKTMLSNGPSLQSTIDLSCPKWFLLGKGMSDQEAQTLLISLLHGGGWLKSALFT